MVRLLPLLVLLGACGRIATNYDGSNPLHAIPVVILLSVLVVLVHLFDERKKHK